MRSGLGNKELINYEEVAVSSLTVKQKFIKGENTKMCMASIWIRKDTGEENLLEEVAVIKSRGNELILSTLFGEQKSIQAKIEEIDFMNSKVLLKEK